MFSWGLYCGRAIFLASFQPVYLAAVVASSNNETENDVATDIFTAADTIEW